MYYRQAFPDRARARFAVADYIEVFYNRQGSTPPSATALPPRRSPNSRPQQPLHDQLPEELSKIVDTRHLGLADGELGRGRR